MGGLPEGYHIAGKPLQDRFLMRNVITNDQGAITWKEGSKTVEGISDVINILKEIQMIFLHI